jgi:hypothetical protein
MTVHRFPASRFTRHRASRRTDASQRLYDMAALFVLIVAAVAVGVVVGHTITKGLANAAHEAAYRADLESAKEDGGR